MNKYPAFCFTVNHWEFFFVFVFTKHNIFYMVFVHNDIRYLHFFYVYKWLGKTKTPLISSPLLFHPPPLALTIGLLSFPLISLHNLLGTVPQSISSCMENAIFFICFMQITPSNTHSISGGKKSGCIFQSCARWLPSWWKCFFAPLLLSTHSSLFLWELIRAN